jgi:hypothetical protein
MAAVERVTERDRGGEAVGDFAAEAGREDLVDADLGATLFDIADFFAEADAALVDAGLRAGVVGRELEDEVGAGILDILGDLAGVLALAFAE